VVKANTPTIISSSSLALSQPLEGSTGGRPQRPLKAGIANAFNRWMTIPPHQRWSDSP
jgi:hypothetical protein